MIQVRYEDASVKIPCDLARGHFIIVPLEHLFHK